MDISAKVVFKRLQGEQKVAGVGWATEPAVRAGGIHVSRTLVPESRFEDIPVRVMNVHTEPITLHKCTDVTALQPLEVLVPVVEER